MRNGDDFTELRDLQRAIDGGAQIVALDGLTSVAAKAYVLSKLSAPGKTIVIVADTNASLDAWEGDINFWTSQISTSSDDSALRTPQLSACPPLKPTSIPEAPRTLRRWNAGRFRFGR